MKKKVEKILKIKNSLPFLTIGILVSTIAITLSFIPNRMNYFNNQTTNNYNHHLNANYSNKNTNSSNNTNLTASALSYDNSKTGLDCKNAQCVIDEITKIIKSKKIK